MRVAPLLLLLTAALAGCTVEPPAIEGQPSGAPPAGPPGAAPGPDAETQGPNFPSPVTAEDFSVDSLVLPAVPWVRGDTWRWTASFTGGTESQQWVMVGETAQDYILASTGVEEAVTQAFRGSSLPGPVNKAFLSGYEQGARTNYLSFPLQQNKTWNVHIRGNDFLVQANYTLRVENGKGPGFDVRGTSITGSQLRLTYDPALKWMTLFQITGPEGQPVFSRTLSGFQQNYTGPYYTSTAEELFFAIHNGTRPDPPLETFEQTGDFERLRLALDLEGTGLAEIHVFDAAGQPQYNLTAQGVDLQRTEIVDLPSVPGTWRVTYLLFGSIEATMRVAGFTVTQGTL